jgi:two-component system CheB/CheR fusion protein
MLHSAINTGTVDTVLVPENMPAQLLDFPKYAFDRTRILATNPHSHTDNTLKKLLVTSCTQTEHDFSEYKQSTIHCHIERIWQ